MGTDWSPVGQIYFYTLHSTNPQYDLMELKSLEDWVLEKQFKSVPNVVDVAASAAPRANIRCASIPKAGRLWAEHRRRWSSSSPITTSTPAAASSKPGLQQINVRGGRARDKRATTSNNTVIKTQERHAAARARTSPPWTQGPKIRLGQFGKAIHRADGKSSTTTTWSKASCCCAKAPIPTPRWKQSTPK